MNQSVSGIASIVQGELHGDARAAANRLRHDQPLKIPARAMPLRFRQCDPKLPKLWTSSETGSSVT
ncbi:hypothetical protein [Sphingomonas guangdongensis]|uniref:hypothetical protein n=1 Tax=Sphingomonas guangdongensis TaxID=1141890 RepID=UPI001181C57C|nr:hypothetical protein [Sphingomonas guangdongensis]